MEDLKIHSLKADLVLEERMTSLMTIDHNLGSLITFNGQEILTQWADSAEINYGANYSSFEETIRPVQPADAVALAERRGGMLQQPCLSPGRKRALPKVCVSHVV